MKKNEHVQGGPHRIRLKERAIAALPQLRADAFAGELPKDISEGALLHLTDRHGRILGTAIYGVQNRAAGWMISKQALARVDADFFAHKFAPAFSKRISFLNSPKTTAFRIFHAEGDGIGGLTVDYYDGHILVSYYSRGLYAYRREIVRAIKKTADCKSIVEKKRFGDDQDGYPVTAGEGRTSEGAAESAQSQAQPSETATGGAERASEGAAENMEPPSAQPSEPIVGSATTLPPFVILENNVKCNVDLIHGGMTGIFTDQREVRKAIRNKYAKGRRVLNLFSYTAMFSVFAALGGASTTTNVDLAKRSHELARQNFALNRLDPDAQEFVTDDVFRFLDAAKRSGRRYDLIIIDPPSFSTSKSGVFSTEKHLGRLIDAAVQVASRRAVLVVSTNHAGITRESFRETVSGRLDIIEEFSLPADYRTARELPESDYLKVAIGTLKHPAQRAKPEAQSRPEPPEPTLKIHTSTR